MAQGAATRRPQWRRVRAAQRCTHGGAGCAGKVLPVDFIHPSHILLQPSLDSNKLAYTLVPIYIV